MARTHKGGPAPPRRDSSSSSGAAVPSPSSAAAPPRPATSGKNLHAPPRPPPAEMPTKGRHAVVFDEAMISLLEGGTEDDDGDEEEWVGLKCEFGLSLSWKAPERARLFFVRCLLMFFTPRCTRAPQRTHAPTDKFKPSSTARSRLGTFTPEPSSGAVVHLEGSSKEDVHGFSAKLDDTIPGGGRDVLLVWDPDRLVRHSPSSSLVVWSSYPSSISALLLPRSPELTVSSMTRRYLGLRSRRLCRPPP